ncbi:MAG: hypothetical protein IGS03_08545 [Candidatus Sericytochromatia bacterium]|nr:hypothetical protein [Candidatus Sericytochromatia bacterium]
MRTAFYPVLGAVLLTALLGLPGQQALAQSEPAPAAESAVSAYSDLARFLNTDQAAQLLDSEPLRSQLQALLSIQAPLFLSSRALAEPVTQVKQGYILSPARSADGEVASLVLLDIEREMLAVIVCQPQQKTYALSLRLGQADDMAAVEFSQYALNWVLGELGLLHESQLPGADLLAP